MTRGFNPDHFSRLGLKPRKHEIDCDPRAEARGNSDYAVQFLLFVKNKEDGSAN